ncbi:hypothetical protein ACVWZ3_002591 [Bradyrhizobium sp. i1.3.6]
MLKGFTVPKSPFGQAALTPPPPWHYAGDAVGVEFWTDPDATAATLPNGLSPDPESNGHAVMLFLDWQFTAQDDEYLEPARYQYREAFVLVDAMYVDIPVMWCPYIYVDNDAALARGWTQGFPKKTGSIFQTRSFVAPGPRRGADGVRQPVWRQPFGAWPASCGSVRHLARAGRRRIVSARPPHGPAALLSEPSGRPPGQACRRRAGDVSHRQSHRCRCMDRNRRAQFSGCER